MYRFSLMMVPPNVTGDLHLGHALTYTIQDAIVRWKRMNGYLVNCYFGTDHAGISTEGVVKRELDRQGIPYDALSSEEFLEHVWKWVRHYDTRIRDQVKQLNVSCDWERYLFTMNEDYSEAVLTSFVRLYEKGLIVRGEYPVNVCHNCKTTLSDLEVVSKQKDIVVQVCQFFTRDGEEYSVVFRQTEDLFGIKAVLVREDHEAAVRELYNPFDGTWVEVIADKDLVHLEVGDFELDTPIAVPLLPTKRKLHFKRYSEYASRNSLHAQKRRDGVPNVKIRKCTVNVRTEVCERCEHPIEVTLSEQWFFKVSALAQDLKRILKEEQKVVFHPASAINEVERWLDSLEDWCISRQIKWGHRLPVWVCSQCKADTVRLGVVESCASCGSPEVVQIPDVLDTWFSCAHWLFANFGWPNMTEEFKTNFPVSLVVTGRDILFFWVIRSMLMSLAHTGKIPMREVLLHGMVLDTKGQKMSKSKGNVISVNELLSAYGSDVVRYGLLSQCKPGKDVQLDPAVFPQVLTLVTNLQQMVDEVLGMDTTHSSGIRHDLNEWVWREVHELYRLISKAMQDYDFYSLLQQVTPLLKRIAKWIPAGLKSIQLFDRDELVRSLKALLLLLEPLLPSFCERNIHSFTQVTETMDIDPIQKVVPKSPVFKADVAEHFVETLNHLANVIGHDKAKQVQCSIRKKDEQDYFFELYEEMIVNATHFQYAGDQMGSVTLRYEVEPGIEVILATDMVETFEPLDKYFRSEIRTLNRELKRIKDRLNNDKFLQNAPVEKVKNEKSRYKWITSRVDSISKAIQSLSVMRMKG